MHVRNLLIVSFLCASVLAFAQAKDTKDIRVALIYDKTGPLEAYMKQTHTGFYMGLDVATSGSQHCGNGNTHGCQFHGAHGETLLGEFY